jgi:hypothetical protein
MTGSDPTLVASVVPVVAFFALAFWLGLCFYAGSHPYWRHQQQPGSHEELASPRQTGTLPPQDQPGLPGSADRAPGVQRIVQR